MSRVVNTEEFEVDIEDIPRSLICTTFEGHMFQIDVNRFNGRVFVQYPKNKESLYLVSRIFQILDMVGFLDDICLDPERLLESTRIVSPDDDETLGLRNECYIRNYADEVCNG